MSKLYFILIILSFVRLHAEFIVPRIDAVPSSELIANVSLYKTNYSYNFNWINYKTSEVQSYQIPGSYWLANYRIDRSLDDILQFYKKYLQKKNGQLLHSDNNNLYFKVSYPAGFISWIHVNAFDKNYKLNIVEEVDQSYSDKAKIDSTKIKKEPDAIIYFEENMCKIAGVYRKNINKILTRMDKDRALILELRGYTSEDEGTEKENSQLAKRRLLKVKKELFNGGIPDNRIFDTVVNNPLELSSDDDKNRRVEFYLKRFDKQ